MNLKSTIRTSLVFILLIFNHLYLFAQKNFIQDTLSHAESLRLAAAYRNSTFGSFWLADSCSRMGDSIAASSYIMQVDPYTLIFEDLSPASIDSYLINNFKLTRDALRKYSAMFTRVYKMPKSAVLKTLKKMFEEDQGLRKKKLDINDSIGLTNHFKTMRQSDSVHFAYLYSYVMKHGWPSLSDGSMYASVIAIHDHIHHGEYLKIMKSAVLRGEVELDMYMLVRYWNSKELNYLNLQTLMNFYDYVVFDIDEILNNKLPASLPDIEKAVQQHSPVMLKIYYISKNRESFAYFGHKMQAIQPQSDCVFYKLYQDVDQFDEKNGFQSRQIGKYALWEISYEPSDFEKPEIKLYLFYGAKKEITYVTTFRKIMSNRKLVTHNINFDVNQSVIKPESLDFIKQMAMWLEQNPAIELEIDGHTDNEGTYDRNMQLSQERAEAIKKQLVSFGVNGSRLKTKGYGDTRPVTTNKSPAARAANRRVEFINLQKK